MYISQRKSQVVRLMEAFEEYAKRSGRREVRELRMDKDMIGMHPVYLASETCSAWRCFRAGVMSEIRHALEIEIQERHEEYKAEHTADTEGGES